jgi:hypothetical protein
MEGFPDRQSCTPLLTIASLLARGFASYFVRALAGCGCSGASGTEQEGDLGRAVGWLAWRWREILPPGLGHQGNRSKPPSVAWGRLTLLSGSRQSRWRILNRAEFLPAKRAARLPEPPSNPITANQHGRQTAPLHCTTSAPGSTQGADGNGPGAAPGQKGRPAPPNGPPHPNQPL